ncbi:MAG: OmpA family protein [Idiomarina sp.]|nr:OmpA family protein [Idiomarina sp.]
MKINKITQAIGTIALLGMALPAMATETNGWYLGGGLGSALSSIADDEITADLFASGFETTDFSENDRDFGFKLFAGYQFNKNFAIEGGYFDLGEFDYTATTFPDGSLNGALSFSGWNLDVVGILPLTERSSLLARVGMHHGKSTASFAGTGAVNVLTPEYSNTGSDYKIGLGYQYHLSEAVSLRVEVERYRMDDAVGNKGDIDLYSLSAIYRFGAPKQAAVAAPAEAPAQRPTQPVAARAEYCSALEIQFEIGNESIEQINQEPILVLATFLNKYPQTNASIEGHTDSVGSEADNLRLSQQRAQSVVDYLVQEHAIANRRLTAIGYGESRPVADNSTAAGQQANRRIKAVIDCAEDIAGLETLPERTTLALKLEFDANSSAVDAKYHQQLQRVAEYMTSNPELIVMLEGHTDNARPATAQRVSEQRAQNVADYLVSNFGIDRSRLNVEGFGATRRDTYNVTAENRQDNRRVNIILGYPK